MKIAKPVCFHSQLKANELEGATSISVYKQASWKSDRVYYRQGLLTTESGREAGEGRGASQLSQKSRLFTGITARNGEDPIPYEEILIKSSQITALLENRRKSLSLEAEEATVCPRLKMKRFWARNKTNGVTD